MLTLTLEHLLGLIGAAVAVGGLAWGFVRWLMAEFKQRDVAFTAQLRERDIAIAAEQARAKLAEDQLARNLAAFQLQSAQTYVSSDAMGRALDRIDEAVNRLTERMDRYFGRSADGRRELG